MNDQTRGLRRTEQADLRPRNSFGIAAHAPLLVEVADPACLADAFAPGWASAASMVLGGGSNLLFAADPSEPLLALTAHRTAVLHDDGDGAVVRAEAGAAWHPFVLWTLQQGLYGLENLALIPGTVGAAPIQNIGAYGVEVADRIVSVEAWDRSTRTLLRLDRDACAFAYRDSRFKQHADRWIVTAVEFALTRSPAVHVEYAGIGDELQAMGIAEPTPTQVAKAVIRLRQRKLPDPTRVGNAGSFFKNPIVPARAAADLQCAHPALPVFRGAGDDSRKLSAAWLIEQAGWKGHRDGDAGVSDRHALVLVNHGAASGAQLLDLARRIAAGVQDRFGVAIEPEPRIVGATW
jgi:UDP-N-acetylmuramate dehydrogenase